ncbi:hypothetical protein [Streptomyces meridianus]|uniref:Uncharacterized protein n=1 Tax=Streptomyces meridianus TaxID=2938945 RepID=A0ABT0XDD4_9ACTN|nr:hypothetical protein [Streptomyces meridianus]MCM2580540.1 hypothetical protein [Streptomyces meridianus]
MNATPQDSPPLTTPTSDRASIRAERRRLRESIRAHRKLLKARKSFELADQKRKNTSARAHVHAQRHHDKAVKRAEREEGRAHETVGAALRALDGDREMRERQTLDALRRQYIDAALRRAPLNAKELNGLAKVLINDLAARGIRTAADFTGFSQGPGPTGRGGSVYWIHTANGRRVHVNGIGEHRVKALTEFRRFHLSRAEERAPRQLTYVDRMKIDELIARQRADLEKQREAAVRTAAAARDEARDALAENTARLNAEAQEADAQAVQRRAEFDSMAEALLALRSQLAALDSEYGGFGARMRRLTSRPHAATDRAPQPVATPDNVA